MRHSNRRTFLKLALGAGIAPAIGVGSPGLRQPVEGATQLIERHALTPHDPWALVHAIRALGGECRLGGEHAATYVLRTYAAKRAVNGRYYLHFPARVEIHTNMFLKTFLEAGVPRSMSFPLDGQTFRLDDLAEGAKALFRFDPGTFDRNDLAWSLIAFAELRAGEWENAYGQRIHLKAVAAFGLRLLQEATQGLLPYFRAGQPLPGKMPVHSLTCGGTHLAYSLLVAARRGFVEAASWPSLRQQLDLLVYRLWADPDLLDRYYQSLAHLPEVEGFRAGAKLKLLGHALECLGYAQAHGLWQPDQGARAQLDRARREVLGLFAYVTTLDLEAARRRSPQLYQQLVGDTCHAFRGLSFL
jgi:hypothetical protein